MSNTVKIRELNDAFRRSLAGEGKRVMTAGIGALPHQDQAAILGKVMQFDQFTDDNDPHGEHDFGAFDHAEQKIFWKIDYYDRASFGSGHDYGSENPADPAATLRVLTVMLAREY